MNPTHIHLALTHFPIVGSFLAIGILLYGIISKNIPVQKVAFVIFIAMAILTVPVFLTGEEAEESVEHLAGVSHDIIEEHEELAEKAIWLMGLLAAFSILSFYSLTKELKSSALLSKVTLLISVLTFVMFAVVGSHGGEIRHSEIRDGVQQTNNHQADDEHGEKDHDDD